MKMLCGCFNLLLAYKIRNFVPIKEELSYGKNIHFCPTLVVLFMHFQGTERPAEVTACHLIGSTK